MISAAHSSGYWAVRVATFAQLPKLPLVTIDYHAKMTSSYPMLAGVAGAAELAEQALQ